MTISENAARDTTVTHQATVLTGYDTELKRLRGLTDDEYTTTKLLPLLLKVRVVPGL